MQIEIQIIAVFLFVVVVVVVVVLVVAAAVVLYCGLFLNIYFVSLVIICIYPNKNARRRPPPVATPTIVFFCAYSFNVLWLSSVGSHKSLQQNAFNRFVCI